MTDRYLIDFACDDCKYVTTALFKSMPTTRACHCPRCRGVARRVLNAARNARCEEIAKRQKARRRPSE